MGFDRAISLADVIARALDLRLADTHVALPAKIVKFNPATQLADVKPLLKEAVEQEDESETAVSIPVITDVPVQFPGSGAFVLTFPVAAGDYCLLVFSDRSLDRWLESGGDVDPQDARRHHLSDAVALLGVRPKPAYLASFDTTRPFLGHVGGPGVAFKTGEVHLGVAENVDATNFVALANLVDSRLSAIKTAFDSHTHTGVTAGAAASGPPAAPLGSAATVAATKVKAV